MEKISPGDNYLAFGAPRRVRPKVHFTTRWSNEYTFRRKSIRYKHAAEIWFVLNIIFEHRSLRGLNGWWVTR